MRTLDEVVKANECCDHGEPDSRCEDCPYNGIGACCLERETDALHYLKEYREKQAITDALPDYYDLVNFWAESMENQPLDWETLKQMTGKPVWVVVDGKERWRIIREVTNEHLILESGLPLHKCWMNHPDGWQAYRKERTN